MYVCLCVKLYIYVTELTSECVRRRKIKLVILSAAEMSKNICTFWQIMTIKILQIVITTLIFYIYVYKLNERFQCMYVFKEYVDDISAQYICN